MCWFNCFKIGCVNWFISFFGVFMVRISFVVLLVKSGVGSKLFCLNVKVILGKKMWLNSFFNLVGRLFY